MHGFRASITARKPEVNVSISEDVVPFAWEKKSATTTTYAYTVEAGQAFGVVCNTSSLYTVAWFSEAMVKGVFSHKCTCSN